MLRPRAVRVSAHARNRSQDARWFDLISRNIIESIRYETIPSPAPSIHSRMSHAAERVFVAGYGHGLRLRQHANGEYALWYGLIRIASAGMPDAIRHNVQGDTRFSRIVATVVVRYSSAILRCPP